MLAITKVTCLLGYNIEIHILCSKQCPSYSEKTSNACYHACKGIHHVYMRGNLYFAQTFKNSLLYYPFSPSKAQS